MYEDRYLIEILMRKYMRNEMKWDWKILVKKYMRLRLDEKVYEDVKWDKNIDENIWGIDENEIFDDNISEKMYENIWEWDIRWKY